jgi:seryl-tRNA synthetase
MTNDPPVTGRGFRDALVAHRLLVPGGAPGIYGNGDVLVDLIGRLEARISRLVRAPNVEVMAFPPVVSLETLERVGYHRTFPHLLGTVHAFDGDDAAHERLVRTTDVGTEWRQHQATSDLALTPAACYAVYPRLTGVLPATGRVVDVESWCFRQEPSSDPGRLRAFRMREVVRADRPSAVLAWRDEWIERCTAFLRGLGLDAEVARATDPFFGRGGRMLADSQRAQGLKFEVLVPVASTNERTAVVSCNYHREHFGELFAIRRAHGKPAHTACVGIGIERLALALLRAHGLDLAAWPQQVRGELW